MRPLTIRMLSDLADFADHDAVGTIACENFSGLKTGAYAWVTGNARCFPRMQYFVAELDGEILGYVLWMEKGGYRDESVWELEQIAVKGGFKDKGIGTLLIKESLRHIRKYLAARGSWLKIVEVTTGTENEAQRLYRKTLGAEVEATVKDLFRGDEVIMIARFSKPG